MGSEQHIPSRVPNLRLHDYKAASVIIYPPEITVGLIIRASALDYQNYNHIFLLFSFIANQYINLEISN